MCITTVVKADARRDCVWYSSNNPTSSSDKYRYYIDIN